VPLPLLAFAFQTAAAVPSWRVLERATVNWRANSAPYEILVEESIPRSQNDDPDHRIRIRIEGRPDFAVVDDRGPGPFLTVKDGLKYSRRGTLRGRVSDSTHLFFTDHFGGKTSAATLLVFGYAYASDANELIVIGLDATGYPKLLFRGDMQVEAITDLDGDGRAELVGRRTIPQGFGKCRETYDPFTVMRFPAVPGRAPRYEEALSRAYNRAHYVWAGPSMSESIEVDACVPGKYRIVERR
jgi:hypothetical protein